MRVDGEGEDDHLGSVGPKQVFHPLQGGPMNKKAVFDQRQAVAGRVKQIPGMGSPVDEGEIKASGKIVEGRFGFGKGVRHHRVSSPQLDGGGQAPGGGVVTVPEGRGKDKNRRSAHIRPSRSSSSNRRSSCWSTISVTPGSSRRMSRQREIFSLGKPVVSITRRPRVK